MIFLTGEAERIRRCRGRVFALRGEPEVARVWLPNIDSPGLAMARALGDFCLKNFGLISVPEISYRCITEKDEFIVLATDGVRWIMISLCFCSSQPKHQELIVEWPLYSFRMSMTLLLLMLLHIMSGLGCIVQQRGGKDCQYCFCKVLRGSYSC